jgi:hypothetical protein
MDGTENEQDISSAEDKETPEQEPETFTKEQHEAELKKARSDALAELGRYKQNAEKAVASAKAAQDRLEQYIRDQEEQELENAKDEPERVKTLKAYQEARKIKAKLAEAQQELKDKEDELASIRSIEVESTKERNAREIATRLGVDESKAVNVAKFTDGSPEAMEAVISELPKKTKQNLRVDSGGTGGGGLNWEKIRDDFIKNPSNPSVQKRYLEAKEKLGK